MDINRKKLGTKSSGWSDIDISYINYDTIYINNSATHFIFDVSGNTYNKPDYYMDANDFITAQIQPNLKKINVGAGSRLSNINFTIVIEYTKTTD